MKFCLFLVAVGCVLANNALDTTVENSFLVMFKKEITSDLRAAHMDLAATLDGLTIGDEWTIGETFKAYHVRCNATLARILAKDASVAVVEEEHYVDPLCETQENARPWGIQRINWRTTNERPGTFTHSSSTAGVDVYVLDTGVFLAHSDFTGRATNGWSHWPGDYDDRNGHGTHVASTAAGIDFGICKTCGIINVKVLNPGSAVGSVLGGIEFAYKNAAETQRRGVINMSLRSRFGKETILNDAVDAAVEAGVVAVSAAGNSNDNTCEHSPSSATHSYTVGATTSSDARASYSSWGTCMNIFAPGSSILAAWIGGEQATNTISGTSMAAPHVAGVAAVILQENPTMSAFDVMSEMTATATPAVVTGVPSGTPNRLLHYICE